MYLNLNIFSEKNKTQNKIILIRRPKHNITRPNKKGNKTNYKFAIKMLSVGYSAYYLDTYSLQQDSFETRV